MKLKKILILTLSLFLIIVTSIYFISTNTIKNNEKVKIHNYLRSYINSIHFSVDEWMQQKRFTTKNSMQSDETDVLLALILNNRKKMNANFQHDLVETLKLMKAELADYDLENIEYVSNNTNKIKLNTILQNKVSLSLLQNLKNRDISEYSTKVFRGKIVKVKNEYVVSLFTILHDNNTILGYLFYQYNISRPFSRIISNSNKEKLSRTLVFTKSLEILNNSSKENDHSLLRKMTNKNGVILMTPIKSVQAILDWKIKYPKQHFVSKSSELYLGSGNKEVFGEWIWDPTNGIGITTEINSDKAFSNYYYSRNVIFIILCLLTLIVSCGAALFNFYSKKYFGLIVQKYHSNKLEELGKFSAEIVHEINNPLTSLVLNISMIKRLLRNMVQIEESDKEKLLKKIDQEEIALSRITRLVKKLKDYTRQDKDELEVVNISEILKENFEFLSPIIEKSGILFEIEEPTQDILVKSRKDQLDQVIVNFVSNAKDALVQSGKNTKIITLSASIVNGRASLKVCDNGDGIPKEVQAKVFDNFFSTKKRGEGTGMGLFICKNIIESFDGVLNLESDDEGTCFHCELPLAS